jgi:hypothetical protein
VPREFVRLVRSYGLLLLSFVAAAPIVWLLRDDVALLPLVIFTLPAVAGGLTVLLIKAVVLARSKRE